MALGWDSARRQWSVLTRPLMPMSGWGNLPRATTEGSVTYYSLRVSSGKLDRYPQAGLADLDLGAIGYSSDSL